MKTESYLQLLENSLRRPPDRGDVIIDLFAGCGGLALGFVAHGFQTIGYEKDPDACATYRKNLGDECIEGFLTTETEFPAVRVVIGGPPCQPFSVGGDQLGLKDSRDGFPIFISAVERVQPEIFLFENVRGMLYRNKWYLDEVVLALRKLGYIVEIRLVKAVAYDVPQNRERIIAIGHRGKFEWPAPRSYAWTAGDAVGDLAQLVPPESRFLNESMDRYVAKYEKASCCIVPRDLHMDRPARTVTCRNLAGATGDMQRIRLPDGRRRRLIPREGARLQSFPDWFEFVGSTDESIFNQIGNAVPPMMAWHFARAIKKYLQSDYRVQVPAIVEEEHQLTLFEEADGA